MPNYDALNLYEDWFPLQYADSWARPDGDRAGLFITTFSSVFVQHWHVVFLWYL